METATRAPLDAAALARGSSHGLDLDWAVCVRGRDGSIPTDPMLV